MAGLFLIPRYCCSDIEQIWSDQARFSLWFDVEISVMLAQMEMGHIPKVELKALPDGFIFDLSRIAELESTVKHDVIAFLSYVSEALGIDALYMHYGMTSSDLVDTCYSIQLARSLDVIIKKLNNIIDILAIKAEENRNVFSVGRSHGIHAEPIVFGTKFLRFYEEFKRSVNRLRAARAEVSVCKISGAMGNYANICPSIEAIVAKKFNLVPESVSSQVIPRDRYAFLFSVLGILGASIENISVEIRGLQRTEISEVSEGFSVGQKGSSAMPHKKNPILAENLTGLSRIIRAAVVPAMENVALWHERDISHSSVERCFSPDVFHLCSFALGRLFSVLDNLIVNTEAINRNLASSRGLVFSQRILLELIKSGLSRNSAYAIVQRNALAVIDDVDINFFDALSSDADVIERIPIFVLESLFDLSYYSMSADLIYERVLSDRA